MDLVDQATIPLLLDADDVVVACVADVAAYHQDMILEVERGEKLDSKNDSPVKPKLRDHIKARKKLVAPVEKEDSDDSLSDISAFGSDDDTQRRTGKKEKMNQKEKEKEEKGKGKGKATTKGKGKEKEASTSKRTEDSPPLTTDMPKAKKQKSMVGMETRAGESSTIQISQQEIEERVEAAVRAAMQGFGVIKGLKRSADEDSGKTVVKRARRKP